MNHQKEPKADRNFVGEKFSTNSSGELKVIERCGKRKTTAVYRVRFLQTGYETKAIKTGVLRGSVKDPYYRGIYGVACKGEIEVPNGTRVKKEYNRWFNMIRRCYDESATGYENYGGRGIEVCERWKCFERFFRDIKKMEGFDDPSKDSIDRVDNDGDYTPRNCQWATKVQQRKNSRRHPSQRKFFALSPDGELFESFNQREFCRTHNLTHSNMHRVLTGEYNHHKKWRFWYEEDFKLVDPDGFETGGGKR